MPPPGRVSETNDVYEERFPILEGQQRKERQKRAQVPIAARVEVRGTDVTRACDGLTAEEKTECPLHDPKAVVGIGDLPTGVRVSLRAGSVVPEHLEQLFACQRTLAVARPQAPTACPFLDAHTATDVVLRPGRVDVELERSRDIDKLRQQVRAALGPRP
jgi:hypothetical protein